MSKFSLILLSLGCCGLVMLIYINYFNQHPSYSGNAMPGQFTSSVAVDHALQLKLPITDTEVRSESREISRMAMQKVRKIDYDGALAITLAGLEKFPTDFTLQSDFAALLGDHSNNFLSPLKEAMIQKSKDVFNKLMHELEGQPKKELYSFKNEYYYRFAKYKEQYELGLERVNDYWGTAEWLTIGYKGYYSQGVGASNYARELVKQENKELALDYAQKAIVAWAQYFSYRNDYYNSYVHYALALGILGYKVEMMRALERSATLIGRDLSYLEFQEVILFFKEKEN